MPGYVEIATQIVDNKTPIKPEDQPYQHIPPN